MIKHHSPFLNTKGTKAWVAFTGQTEIGLLKGLKEGFRHCFVIMHDGQRWISIDPMANHMEVVVHEVDSEFDMPSWLRSRGYTVVQAEMDHSKMRMAPVLPFTCVEAVKRILGIRAWHVLTPWQLYNFLCKQNVQSSHSNPKEIFNGQFTFSSEHC